LDRTRNIALPLDQGHSLTAVQKSCFASVVRPCSSSKRMKAIHRALECRQLDFRQM
jgi:hypothetical protein